MVLPSLVFFLGKCSEKDYSLQIIYIPYDFRGNRKMAIKFIRVSIKPQSNHVKIDLNRNPTGV